MIEEIEQLVPQMMDDVKGALEEWYGPLGFKVRTQVTAELGALPDVMMDLRSISTAAQVPDVFGLPLRLEQVNYLVVQLDLSFMVDNADEVAAHTALLAAAARLSAHVAEPGTVLGEVTYVSPEIDTNFETPLVEYSDGTVGRYMEATCQFVTPYEI